MRGSALALYDRPHLGFDTRVAQAEDLLRSAAASHGSSIVQATSLGVEDMVITDMIARHRLNIAVGTLETGMLHPETLALIPRIEARYGLVVEVYRPAAEAVIHFLELHGDRAMYESVELRKGCCAIRKLEPLSRMLHGRTAWIAGLRREQSDNRGTASVSELDDNGRQKLNPLADWSWNDVWHYIAVNEVPYNPLHDQFMPSIGCSPCTRAIAVGEPFRAGRWWWEDEKAKECGLHVHQEPASSLIGDRS